MGDDLTWFPTIAGFTFLLTVVVTWISRYSGPSSESTRPIPSQRDQQNGKASPWHAGNRGGLGKSNAIVANAATPFQQGPTSVAGSDNSQVVVSPNFRYAISRTDSSRDLQNSNDPTDQAESWTREKPVLGLKKVNKSYRSGRHVRHVLRSASIELFNEVNAIYGSNGSGKSTALQLLAGIDRPDDGFVMYQGHPIQFDQPRYLNEYRQQVAYVRQQLNLFRDCSAVQNVAFALTRNGFDYATAMELAREQLCAVQIDRRTARRYPDSLSGGQQQRCAIARALLAIEYGRVRAVFADEPTSAIDSASSLPLFQLLVDAAIRKQVPLVVVTHCRELASQADRVFRCEDGLLKEIETHSSPRVLNYC